MHRLTLFAVIMFQLPFLVWARCNDNYADNLIKNRFSECDSKELINAVHDHKQWFDQCGKKVSDICADGCYDAIFQRGSELEKSCNKKYVEALKPCDVFITEQAKKNKCSDTGDFLKKAERQEPDSVCTWVTRYPSKMQCGKDKMLICSGEALCSQESEIKGITIPKGIIQIVCASKTEENCENLGVSYCVLDESIQSSSRWGSVSIEEGKLNKGNNKHGN